MANTRDKLIDVARQLFAKMGLEHTTMNDIAQASLRGRRTLYTYFKSKEDIYDAVIEREMELILHKMTIIAKENLPPDVKLMQFIFTRLDAIKEVVSRNGTLKAEFFRNIWRVEMARKNIEPKEVALLKGILQEGVDQEVFEIIDIDLTVQLLYHSLRGLDVPNIRGNFSGIDEKKRLTDVISQLIMNGIKKRN